MHLPRHRSIIARFTTLCVLSVLTIWQVLALALAVYYGVREKSIPLELLFVISLMISIFVPMLIYFSIAIRGYYYSPIGPFVPRRPPKDAWSGTRANSFLGVGGFRSGGFAYWAISDLGISFTILGCIWVFVPWDEIDSIQPTKHRYAWAISHRAPDIKSPIFCGHEVMELIDDKIHSTLHWGE